MHGRCSPPERLLCVVLLSVLPLAALADRSGRLLATGGAVSIEATAGGGITPWAVLAGYGTDEQVGCAAALTGVHTDDYTLQSAGGACTWGNRIELSIGRQELDLDGLRPVLGLPDNQMLRQRYAGLKVRLAGDIVYSDWGQLSAGVLYRQSEDKALVRAAGATDTTGIDGYLSAGKLFLDGPLSRMAYADVGRLRFTRANQGGLLGFGGDRRRQLPRQHRTGRRAACAQGPCHRYRVPPEAGQSRLCRRGRLEGHLRCVVPVKAHLGHRRVGVPRQHRHVAGPERTLYFDSGKLMRSTAKGQYVAGRAKRYVITGVVLMLTACTNQATAPDRLYSELGGEPGITRIVEELIRNIADDPRITHHFTSLVAGFPATASRPTSGGSRVNPAPSMAEACAESHRLLDVADFNALVEDLIDAMDELDIDHR
ncbi:MAG: DUF3034 family protein [Woeseiaceae bacterium]|nr:DUF3034 family protein [Woeseiaceae bacterium]